MMPYRILFGIMLGMATVGGFAVADQHASASYTLDGGTMCCGGSRSGSSAHDLVGVVAAPAPPGPAAGLTLDLDSGYRVPSGFASAVLRYVLAPGWNLKGSPVDSIQTVAAIFRDAQGLSIKLDGLYCWEPAGAFYSIVPDTAPLAANRGFWVFSYWGGISGEVTGAAGDAGEWTDHLADGWNLYSPTHYVSVPLAARQAGVDVVWWWNAVTQEYERVFPRQNLVPGEGYWIRKQSR